MDLYEKSKELHSVKCNFGQIPLMILPLQVFTKSVSCSKETDCLKKHDYISIYGGLKKEKWKQEFFSLRTS